MKSAKKVRGERGNRTHQRVGLATFVCSSTILCLLVFKNNLFSRTNCFTLNLNDCINMRKTISLPTLPSQAIGINIYLHEKLLSMKLIE